MMVVVLVAVVNQIPGSNPAASIFLKMGHSRPLYFRLVWRFEKEAIEKKIAKITKMLLDIVTFSWKIISNKFERRSVANVDKAI